MGKDGQKNQKKYNQKGLNKKTQNEKDQKAQQRADLGRQFELTVTGILGKMLQENKIAKFTYNKPNSLADQQGKDFTVTKIKKNGEEITHSFGVTISQRSWERAKNKHPFVPQFFFPVGTDHKTIEKEILDLFD